MSKGKSFIIERFDDWKRMREALKEMYESTYMREDTYVMELSPFTNSVAGHSNRRVGERLVAGHPVVEEIRHRTDRTILNLQIQIPSGEHTEYKMEKGPDGKDQKVIENGKPVILDQYYRHKEKRVHYVVTLDNVIEKDAMGNKYPVPYVTYGPWEQWGEPGSVRSVFIRGRIEMVEGKPKSL